MKPKINSTPFDSAHDRLRLRSGEPFYIQLQLPLFPKLKRNQKIKIKGLDSDGEYPNLVGKVGIIFAIANNGIWVRFPGRYLGRTRKGKVNLVLLYSIWNIEYN